MGDSPKVDHYSTVSLAEQLAAIIREQIRSGDLGKHDHLPSESQLMGEHGISRGTVRRALQTLIDEGLITSLKGRGSVVN